MRCQLALAERTEQVGKSDRIKMTMAIYHLRHSFVGRQNHKPGTATAHINYITRQNVCTDILSSNVANDRHKAKEFFVFEEIKDRKNARVIDKLIVALPCELNHQQHKKLLEDFCKVVTKERCPWFIAIHSHGKDIHNPHAHIVLRDRDIETNKRVMKTTSRGSTVFFRKAWEQHLNKHLELNGHDVRVSAKTLRDQGVFDRIAQIHIGPEANEADKKGYEFKSKKRPEKKKVGHKKDIPKRDKPPPEIEDGISRRKYNQEIIQSNIKYLKESDNYGKQLRGEFEEQYRKKLDKFIAKRDKIREDFNQKNAAINKKYGTDYYKIKAQYNDEKNTFISDIQRRFKPIWADYFQRRRNALENYNRVEKEFSSQLKKDLDYYWNQLGLTQDHTRGRLSKIFDRNVNKEERIQTLKDEYRKEKQKIAKDIVDQQEFVKRQLNKKYGPDLKKISKAWDKERQTFYKNIDDQWDDHKKDFAEFRKDQRKEREFLEEGLKEYYKSLDEPHYKPKEPEIPKEPKDIDSEPKEKQTYDSDEELDKIRKEFEEKDDDDPDEGPEVDF